MLFLLRTRLQAGAQPPRITDMAIRHDAASRILALGLRAVLTLVLLALPSPAAAQSHLPENGKPQADTVDCLDESATPRILEAGKRRVDVTLPARPPMKGASYRDASQGVCITRLTDHESEPPVGFAKNIYSRQQAFNADESLILIFARDGHWHLYDARTSEYVRQLDLGGGSVEPQWHPADPDIIYLLPNKGGLSLHAYHVRTDQQKKIADFTELDSIAGFPGVHDIRMLWPDAARIWTRWEGSPSMNARYWAFQVETEDERPLALITFDLAKKSITGSRDIREIGRPDHISMSPKGNYAVASWPEGAADCPLFRSRGTLEKPCGVMAFTRDLKNARGLAAKSPHSDLAIAANGREVIVISNYDSGNLEMIDLATGDVTPLWRMYIDGASTALHVSGKAWRKPGWALVSTYAMKDPKNAKPWYENRLIAVELKKNPRIINVAAIVNDARTYFSEPHASVNRDFTRIVFNANWGSGKDDDIDTYVARLSPGAIPGNGYGAATGDAASDNQ